MGGLLVIGGAPSDALRLTDRTATCAGGAAINTALAAARCGAPTTLFGLRPIPRPEPFQSAASRLAEWIAPVVAPGQLTESEISYVKGDADYLRATPGAEETLAPPMLPADLGVAIWRT